MVEPRTTGTNNNSRTKSQREQMQGAVQADPMKPSASGDQADSNPLAMSNRKPEKND